MRECRLGENGVAGIGTGDRDLDECRSSSSLELIEDEELELMAVIEVFAVCRTTALRHSQVQASCRRGVTLTALRFGICNRRCKPCRLEAWNALRRPDALREPHPDWPLLAWYGIELRY